MRTHTTSIQIETSPDAAFAFVADAAKLPVWAIAFAKAIERASDGWMGHAEQRGSPSAARRQRRSNWRR
jgi:hypothetical protein